MQTDPWTSPVALGRSETVASSFMASVYRWMAAGLGLTGLVAFGVASSPAAIHAIFGTPLMWVLVIAQLGVVFLFGRAVRTASFGTVAAMFLGYSALTGATLASVLLVYTRESVASTFFITGGTFFAMSAYATLTKSNLSSWGNFLMMGLIGVVLASVVNIFLHSSALGFIISCAGVVVFTGLTAYDTQQIRSMAGAGDGKLALSGALRLYLDFINLFLMLLQFFGRRRD